MPETTVDENRNTGSIEDQIGAAAEVFQRLSIDSVSQAASMHCRPNGHLWPRVAPSIPSHNVTSRGR